MKYLLDTNTCIRLINGRSPALRARFYKTPAADIAVCSIVKAELFSGSARSQTPALSRAKQELFLKPFPSLPFDDNVLSSYSQLRADLENRGMPIGPLDTLIAAIAVANQLILVTHNTREFSRVQGLALEDWELPE